MKYKHIYVCMCIYIYIYIYFVCLFCFLGPHLQHMEVPKLVVELGLQQPAYTTATATQDPSLICDLYHSSWQCRIPTSLSRRPGIEHASSWIPVTFIFTVPHRNSISIYRIHEVSSQCKTPGALKILNPYVLCLFL